MRSLAVSTLAAACAVFGFACGPGPDQGLSPENAATAGQAMAATVSGGADFARSDAMTPGTAAASDGTIRLSAAARLIGLAPTLNPGGEQCWTVSGDGSDPDQDGIPTDVTVTYDCTETLGNTTARLTGSQFFRDTSPIQSPFNFTAGADAMRIDVDNPVQQVNGFIAEDWAVTASQAGANFQLELSGTLTAEDHRPNRDNTLTTSQNLTHLLDVAARTLTVDGDWSIDINGQGAATTLSTTPNVHFEETCETNIDSGGVAGAYEDTDGNSASLEVNWTGCGAYNVIFNGEQVGDQNS